MRHRPELTGLRRPVALLGKPSRRRARAVALIADLAALGVAVAERRAQ